MNAPAMPPFGSFPPTAWQRRAIALARLPGLNRGIFRARFARLIGALGPDPIDASFEDVAFRLYPQSSNVDLGMLLRPDYNMAEIAFLRSRIPAGGTFIDIGAHIGLYSILVGAPFGPAATVLAVEPNGDVLGRLGENVALSGSGSVTVLPVAVGPEDGEAGFLSEEGNLGGSRMAEGGATRVPMHRLATIAEHAGFTTIDALKIDIEGFEDRALLPFFAEAPPELWPGAIVIEQTRGMRWEHGVIDHLLGIGYRRVGATRSNAMLARG